MSNITRTSATSITLPGLPAFSTGNSYPLSRLKSELLFAIAQRGQELADIAAPSVTGWINDAYQQVLSMLENPRLAFSSSFTLPIGITTVAIDSNVAEVYTINKIVDTEVIPLHKNVDIEFWRSLDYSTYVDQPFTNFLMARDAGGILLQFRPQTEALVLIIDGQVKPPALVADTDCPALTDTLCLGLLEMAISIALRRFGEYTYAGAQNNAGLAIIRSSIDERGKDKKGVIAAVSRPRTLEEARRIRGS